MGYTITDVDDMLDFFKLVVFEMSVDFIKPIRSLTYLQIIFHPSELALEFTSIRVVENKYGSCRNKIEFYSQNRIITILSFLPNKEEIRDRKINLIVD